MDDNADRILEALRKGAIALTVPGLGKPFLHAFLPRAPGPTLQVSSPTEFSQYHLRAFVDGGELVFLVTDQDAPRETPDGRRNPARHPWVVRVPVVEVLRVVEQEVGEQGVEEFVCRLSESYSLITAEVMKQLWIVVGMFDADPLAGAFFEGGTTAIPAESAARQTRIVGGDQFLAEGREVGLILNRDASGNPAVRHIVHPLPAGFQPPAGFPEGVVAVALEVQQAWTEWVRFACRMLETIRPIVQSRTSFPLPIFPDPEAAVIDAMKSMDRYVLGLKTYAGMALPWDRRARRQARWSSSRPTLRRRRPRTR